MSWYQLKIYLPIYLYIFARLATIQFPITFPLLILFRNQLYHLAAWRMGFHMVYCMAAPGEVVYEGAYLYFDPSKIAISNF